MRAVDIVIPVYDGFEETDACLRSVLRTVNEDWARIVVINDCSPNPRITQYLRDLHRETGRFDSSAKEYKEYPPHKTVLRYTWSLQQQAQQPP